MELQHPAFGLCITVKDVGIITNCGAVGILRAVITAGNRLEEE
jgi:hypothetical protein